MNATARERMREKIGRTGAVTKTCTRMRAYATRWLRSRPHRQEPSNTNGRRELILLMWRFSGTAKSCGTSPTKA